MTKELAKNYRCQCGKRNDFPAYVISHWFEPIFHKCDCGRKNILLKGEVVHSVSGEGQ